MACIFLLNSGIKIISCPLFKLNNLKKEIKSLQSFVTEDNKNKFSLLNETVTKNNKASDFEELVSDNKDEQKVAQLMDLRNIHYGIYELVNTLFYEKHYDKYNISNKLHIKSGTLKYYYEYI